LWNDKRNLGEILNEKAGFNLNFMNNGSRNLISYNGFDEKNISVFRDGIQINDLLYSGFDIENISVNEIDKIEIVSAASSVIYGINNMNYYTNNKAINVLTKDYFIPKTFAQLRYSQDRYNSLNADISFFQPLSDKVSVLFGANNNNIDGRYTNSDFSVWRARGRINYFPTPLLNFRININYSKIQRGLNEGLIYSTTDTLSDPILAQVKNSDLYEKITNYYADLKTTIKLFGNNSSLTKISFWTQNTLRELRDENNRPLNNTDLIFDNLKTIQYGLELKQNYLTLFSDNMFLDVTVSESYILNSKNLNYFEYDSLYGNLNQILNYNDNISSIYAKANLFFSESFISAFIRKNNNNINRLYFGIESKIKIMTLNDYSLFFYSGGNKTPDTENTYYLESSVEIINKLNFFKINFYKISQYNSYNQGISFEGYFIFNKIFLKYIYNYSDYLFLPAHNIKTDISYEDFFFNNKLKLKFGVNIKYSNKFVPLIYNVKYNTSIYNNYQQIPSKNAFNFDFYIGARIGRANVNFTLENLFNNFNYNTYLYPMNDRGGALRVISRFTIVWDFLN
jgi:hypothetical protein